MRRDTCCFSMSRMWSSRIEGRETIMAKIDLNCDLGESFSAYTMGMDDKVIPLIS